MVNQSIAYFASLVRNSRDLNWREKEILLNRLKKKTLKKIGRRYKLSGERIRQVEKEAIKKFVKKINQLLLFD